MPDPNNPLGLHPNHPLYVQQQQRRAAGAQALASTMPRPPAYASLARPDGSGGQLPNQNPAPTSYLMRETHVNPFNAEDDKYNQASQSGIEGQAGFGRITGGGSAGSMQSALLAQHHGDELMGGLPKLAAMAPYVKGSQPNTARAFAQVDNQVNAIAARERQGIAGGSAPQMAARPAAPQGIAATAPAAAPGRFAPQMGPPKPAPRPLRTLSGGQIDPRFVGNRQQVARAQMRTGQRPALAAGVNNAQPVPPRIQLAGAPPAVPMGGIAGASRADRHRAMVDAAAAQARAGGFPMAAVQMQLEGHERAAQMEHEDALAGPQTQLAQVQLENEKLKQALGPHNIAAIGSGALSGPAAESAVNNARIQAAGGTPPVSRTAMEMPISQGAPNPAYIDPLIRQELLPKEGMSVRAAFEGMQRHGIDPSGPQGAAIRDELRRALGENQFASETSEPELGGWTGLGGIFGPPTPEASFMHRFIKGYDAFDPLAGVKEHQKRLQMWKWGSRPTASPAAARSPIL